jgi:hypothetical protein
MLTLRLQKRAHPNRSATKRNGVNSTPRAMLELEHALMAGRIMDARSEILRRLEALRDMPGLHASERLSIQDALSSLRSLEREEVRYADEKHRKAAKLALEKLGPESARRNNSVRRGDTRRAGCGCAGSKACGIR